jgi:3-hydroxyisobutyrate dehydrogenase-like beta-hydroxyacid dehydrogenase
MGEPMARRLLEAGYNVSVAAHRNRKPVDALISAGADEATSYAAMAAACDVIMLCVSNSTVVETVVSEMRPSLKHGQIIIDTSTSDPEVTRNLAHELAKDGIGLCDAPLTGGPEQAAAGQLGVLLGAQDDQVERVMPILKAFANRIEHFGGAGSGHAAKLINNYLVCGMVALIADTYNSAHDAGIDWSKLFEVMQSGSSNSGALRKIVAPALEGDFDGYRFSLANAHKDMTYYIRLSDKLAGPSDLARSVMAEFDDAVERGLSDKMVSRLIDPHLQG